MFYCNGCQQEKDWPKSIGQSIGKCEICEKQALCYDVPSGQLPVPELKSCVEDGGPKCIPMSEADPELTRKYFAGCDPATDDSHVVIMVNKKGPDGVDVIEQLSPRRGSMSSDVVMYDILRNRIEQELQKQFELDWHRIRTAIPGARLNEDFLPRVVDPRSPEELMRERGLCGKAEYLRPEEVIEKYGDRLPERTVDALSRLSDKVKMREEEYKHRLEHEPSNEANEQSYEMIAQICHAAHNAYCETQGQSNMSWENRSQKHRDTVINGVRMILEGEVNSPSRSHWKFVTQKIKDGWKYGEEYDVLEKTNPRLVSWDDLPMQEKMKDILFFNIVKTFAI